MKKIINEIKYFFTRNIEHLDLPFPLFEVTEDEALLLRMAYDRIKDCEYYACLRLYDLKFDATTLINKIQIILHPHTKLASYISDEYSGVLGLNQADLRKAWVRKLLEHNGFSTEGLK